jgi:hypothetical protein
MQGMGVQAGSGATPEQLAQLVDTTLAVAGSIGDQLAGKANLFAFPFKILIGTKFRLTLHRPYYIPLGME